MFKNQISSLVIETTDKTYFEYDLHALIFTNLITMFSNLKCLNFDPCDVCFQTISFKNLPPSVFSSTLLELYIKVNTMDDCLHLLDGRFDQLRVFNVKIKSSGFPSVSKINQVDLK
jgi:hypothetical protein